MGSQYDADTKQGEMPLKPSMVGKKAVLGTLQTLVGDYFVYGVNFVRAILLARILTPEIYGVFRLAEFFKGVFGQPKNIGFDQALIHQASHPKESYNGHLLLNGVTGLIGIGLALLASPILFQLYDDRVVWVLYVLMVTLFVQGLSSTPGVYLVKHFRFGLLSIVNVVAAVLSFGISLYLALNGWGVWALVAIPVSTETIKFTALWLFSGWQPGLKVDWGVNKEMLKFGGVIWFGGLFSFIMLQFDDFLVGQFAGLTILGFYSKAYALAQQPLGLFSQVINKVAAPTITALRDRPDKLEQGLNLVLGLVFKGTIFIGMVLFIWAPELILMLIGEKWLPMVPMFRGLILYLTVQPIWDVIGSFLTFTGRPKLFVKGQAVQAVLLLVLGSMMVYRWGGIGAAIIVSGILLTTTAYFLYFVMQKQIRIKWWNVFVLPSLVVVLSGLVGNFIIDQWLGSGVWFWLGVLVIPGMVYAGILFLTQGALIKCDIEYLVSVAKQKSS